MRQRPPTSGRQCELARSSRGPRFTNVPALAPIPGQLVLIELVEPGDPGDDRVDRALAGYSAGYSGSTLVGYRLDLRQWAV
jgi:hypothetical protein